MISPFFEIWPFLRVAHSISFQLEIHPFHFVLLWFRSISIDYRSMLFVTVLSLIFFIMISRLALSFAAVIVVMIHHLTLPLYRLENQSLFSWIFPHFLIFNCLLFVQRKLRAPLLMHWVRHQPSRSDKYRTVCFVYFSFLAEFVSSHRIDGECH